MGRSKKWLTIVLAAVVLLGSITGTVWTEEVNTAEVFEAEYLPAPAVAGLLLEAVGVCNRYGTGRDGGNYIRDVANHMGPGTDFYGVSKYDPFHYAVAVAEYLNTNNPLFPAGVISPWETAVIDLTVVGAPTQTVYIDQESLCLNGLVVELKVKLPWSDAATIPVAYADFAEYYLTADLAHGQLLGTEDTEVKITHTYSGKNASQYITVQSIVTFKDWNGEVLKEETVEHGIDATAPHTDPQRTGYTFAGWDKDFTQVTGNVVVTAQYTLNTYTVTFEGSNGAVLAVETVEHGSDAIAPHTEPQRTGYTFAGWDTDFMQVTGNLVVTAQYTLNTYTVTFEDWDGAVLKEEIVEHGSDATAPHTDPQRTGYTFTDWDKDFTQVTGNLTVTAQYTLKTYTVTFRDWNGNELKEETVEHGSDATAPHIDAQRTGYSFTGWDKDFTQVTGNLVVTAQYRLDALYLWGEQIVPFVPGFSQSSGSQSFEHDHLHLKADGASRSERTYVTAVPVNLTDVRFIYIRWVNDGSFSSSNRSELIASTVQSDSCLTFNARLERRNAFTETNSVYVTNLSGDYYIRVHAHTHSTPSSLTSNLKVYEITLVY